MTTLSSGVTGLRPSYGILSAFGRLAFAPQQVTHDSGHEHGDGDERRGDAVTAEVCHRLIAVLDRENAEREVSAAPAEDDGEGEPQYADVRDAGQEDKDLERHGRRKNRRHKHGEKTVPPES